MTTVEVKDFDFNILENDRDLESKDGYKRILNNYYDYIYRILGRYIQVNGHFDDNVVRDFINSGVDVNKQGLLYDDLYDNNNSLFIYALSHHNEKLVDSILRLAVVNNERVAGHGM